MTKLRSADTGSSRRKQDRDGAYKPPGGTELLRPWRGQKKSTSFSGSRGGTRATEKPRPRNPTAWQERSQGLTVRSDKRTSRSVAARHIQKGEVFNAPFIRQGGDVRHSHA